jgi:hypothetical protein
MLASFIISARGCIADQSAERKLDSSSTAATGPIGNSAPSGLLRGAGGPYEDQPMRTCGYWLGAGLLVAGAAAAVAELLAMLQGAPATLSIGAIWFRIHANSLVGFQALIEQGVTPLIWPPIQWLLTLPTWLVLVPPGLLLVLLCRDKGGR